MPTLDLGQVKGDTGTSLRNRETWTANTAYVNNSQYIDIVTNDGNLYMCKTSHTSETTFSDTNWTMVVQKGDKGDVGVTPTIQAGTATILDANDSPTVSATTSGDGTTTFNFGIPKGDTSEIETPTFNDTVETYTTLTEANTAAETASNAIKSKVSIFTTLSNMKKSFSAIVQGLKILGTNVGAINGITSDINSESTTIAASSKMVHDLNTSLGIKQYNKVSQLGISSWDLFDIIDHMPNNSVFTCDASKITTVLVSQPENNLGIIRITRISPTRVLCEHFMLISGYTDSMYIISLNMNTKSIEGTYRVGMTRL